MGINVSLADNRKQPENGDKAGRLFDIIGEVNTVPTIKFFKKG